MVFTLAYAFRLWVFRKTHYRLRCRSFAQLSYGGIVRFQQSQAQRLFMLLRDCVPRRLGTVSALGTSSTLLPVCFTHLSLFCFHWARRATIQTSKGLHSGLVLFSGCGYLDSVRLKTPHSLDILRQLSIVTTKTQRFGLHSGLRFLFRPRYKFVRILI